MITDLKLIRVDPSAGKIVNSVFSRHFEFTFILTTSDRDSRAVYTDVVSVYREGEDKTTTPELIRQAVVAIYAKTAAKEQRAFEEKAQIDYYNAIVQDELNKLHHDSLHQTAT
jgi:hypothetical protein